jgi:tetratricopeptide (TPR) repeat protein
VQVRILFSLFRVRWSRPPPQDRAERTAHWAGLEALARERLNRALRALGPHSLDSLHAQVNLAEVAIEQGNHRAAAEMCRAVLANSSERLGDCHKVRGEARSVLAVALSALGEADEPAELALRVVACTRNVAGPHPIVLLSDIADALKYVDRAGRAEEGEALAREALALLTTMGAQHGDLAFNIESYIAHFVSMRGRQDEAEELFARLLAAEESVPFTNTRARLYLFHGAHLARRAQFEQAERQLQRAVALQGDILSGTWDQQPDDIVVAFAQLYRAWQKPERVREYEELRERAFGIPAPR